VLLWGAAGLPGPQGAPARLSHCAFSGHAAGLAELLLDHRSGGMV